MKNVSKLVSLLVIALIFGSFEAYAQKEKNKEKKTKPIYVCPKLTSSEDFNRYLLTCDTLYTRIQSYNDSITYYKVAQADTGLKDDTGLPLYKYAIVDNQGNVRNPGRALKQYADFILTGTDIVLDCTTLTLLTVTATASLPSLGFDALSYAKYLKAGPKIVAMGGDEIKEIITSCKTQAKAIRALKKSSTNTGDNKDVVLVTSTIPNGVELIPQTSEEFDAKVSNSVKDENIVGADQYEKVLDDIAI